jgi:hypothetical protein
VATSPRARERGCCFLCNRPVDNERVFAICFECDDAHEVRALWAIDYGENEARRDLARTVGNDRDCEDECHCPGWLWMNEENDASFNIERCDSCRAYGDDAEAARAMVERCKIRGVEWP